jgi:acyl dehydratase
MRADGELFDRPFGDLEVGGRFATRGRTIGEADVICFAALTGDWHPQHADADWAAGSPFGERIAHGMLVLSYAVGLVPFDPDRIVALRRVGDVVFKLPVRLGDTIHVEGRIERLAPLEDGAGLVACLWRIVNQEGRTVARATVEVVWLGEAAAAERAA